VRFRESVIMVSGIRETDIWEGHIGERDIWETDIRKTVATCPFAQ
jgi:hypothetical protein